MKTVLVVDDERSIRESVRMVLKDFYIIRFARDGEEALEAIAQDAVDLVILDVLLPSADGLAVLRDIKRKSSASVIMLTAINKVKTAVEAMKLGAADYIVKPFDAEELRLVVERAIKSRQREEELDYLRSEIERNYPTGHIIAESDSLKGILAQVEKVSATPSTVLITGESGTGKELIARAIHQKSPRASRSFVALQCAAIPEGILESELFGHERGAFTGATRSRRGVFELADGGTLFLDEISEMSLATQVKILRSLQEKEFMRVGGQSSIKVDVRLIAATNRDLRERVREGRFREDLFYRLNVIPIHVPPLRKRIEDILPLAEYFLERFSLELHGTSKRLSPEACRLLEGYQWPGNVRELKNVIERIVALEPMAPVVLPSHLHLEHASASADQPRPHTASEDADSLEEAANELEKCFILEALRESDWNQTRAARRLKLTRRKLKYRMDRLGIPTRRRRGRPRRAIA